ncbi:acetyltransferase [Hanamia caeni]|jgi:sugar O-acyltransferase (sialic acid O-acetyltransferase NeuD family)|uniref:Acetyltransferase n=1 Tax=Hanamia caeni TaxID=2294116 RepID=A0A3M9NBN5_9BACT|nr:acetyltransferase [Hanamia caeni]RNI35222.1 acetyltransferase [Hanamia caeni]
MNKTKLILIGGGGHCKSCIDVIEQEGKFQIEGILDKEENFGNSVLGYKVIGTDQQIHELSRRKYSFLITIGQIKSALIRKSLFEKLAYLNVPMATVISPLAYVSKYSLVDKGTIVMHHANINAGVKLGMNNIINTGALIEHDCSIGNHCHISTKAVVNGGCTIGNEVFIGSGTVIYNGVQIQDLTVVSAGSVVSKDIDVAGIYKGNPVKRLGK